MGRKISKGSKCRKKGRKVGEEQRLSLLHLSNLINPLMQLVFLKMFGLWLHFPISSAHLLVTCSLVFEIGTEFKKAICFVVVLMNASFIVYKTMRSVSILTILANS